MSRIFGNSHSRDVPKYIKEALPNTCNCCGKECKLEYHHIVAYREGGMMNLDNIVQLCHDCHMDLHRQIRKKEKKEAEERYKWFVEHVLMKMNKEA